MNLKRRVTEIDVKHNFHRAKYAQYSKKTRKFAYMNTQQSYYLLFPLLKTQLSSKNTPLS